MWAMVGNDENGLAILNDSKYSYSANGNLFSLTAIRSPIYCDHGMPRHPEDNFTDQGIHEFVYELLPSTTSDKTKLFHKALALNTPPTLVMENHHAGKLPLSLSGLGISQKNILVSALKKSEDGKGYVLRAYECDGKTTDVSFTLHNLGTHEAHFTPHEIKTFYVDANSHWKEVLFTEFSE
jgi:alpha-mannosidase